MENLGLHIINTRLIIDNMSGTVEGGKKCAQTNKKKFGTDWFRKIGTIGGRNGHTGGFASNRELAVEAGRKGGRISKRGKKK